MRKQPGISSLPTPSSSVTDLTSFLPVDELLRLTLKRQQIKDKEYHFERAQCGANFTYLLKLLQKKYCAQTKSGNKQAPDRTKKFLMSNFVIETAGDNDQVVVRKKSDKHHHEHTKIKRSELIALLGDPDIAITIDLADGDQSDVRDKDESIRSVIHDYLQSLQFFALPASYSIIEKVQKRLATPGKISIQRSTLLAFLQLSSYQFGGK